jgi:hypothetical protein
LIFWNSLVVVASDTIPVGLLVSSKFAAVFCSVCSLPEFTLLSQCGTLCLSAATTKKVFDHYSMLHMAEVAVLQALQGLTRN